jgi:outer membrane protein, heavy metal efflux system
MAANAGAASGSLADKAPAGAETPPTAASKAPPASTAPPAGPAAPPLPPSPDTAAASLTLPQAMALALGANRELAAARLQLPVANANLAVAGERPNPDLLLEALRETPRQAATLSLPIETAGKRQRRIAAAAADVASGEADLARATATVRNRVRRAFYSLLAAERRQVETEANLDLAKRAGDAARQRFAAGAAPRLDALQAELAVAQASNDAEASRAQMASAEADLDTLLGRPPTAPVTAQGDLAAGTVPAAAVARALGDSRELALLDRHLAAQAAKVALAKAQQAPNPVLQGAITHDAQPEFLWGWRAGLSVTLPIFTTHHGEVEVEEATLAQLAADRGAAAERVAGEVTAAAAQATAAQGQALRFRDDILPRAVEVEALAEESYRAGETGLVALLQALQAARDTRLRAVQAGLDFQIALADLEQALGAPLP